MQLITTTIEDKVAILTLNHNEQNTLTPPFMDLIIKTCLEVDNNPDVNVILMTSAAKTCFSSGLDLKEMSVIPLRDMFGSILKILDILYALKKPLVVALNGFTIAGGGVIAMIADFRYMSTDARFSLNEVKLGIPMPRKLIDIVKNAIGPLYAKELCYLGTAVRADEALKMGIADAVSEPDKLYEETLYFAKKLAKLDPIALQTIKKNFRYALIHEPIEDKKNDVLDVIQKIEKSQVLQSVITRFNKK